MTGGSTPRSLPVRPPRKRLRLWILLIGLLAAALSGGRFLLTRQPTDPDRVWADAQSSLRAGQIDRARASLTRLTGLREPTPLDWMLRGQVELAEGHIEEALRALASVPDRHAIASQARLLAGQIELRRHRARVAEQLLRDALRLDPGLVQAHRELIYILGYQLRRADLDAHFEALSRLAELTFDNVFHWGLLHTAHWDPASAIDELQRFIEADPEDRWSRLALAENYRRAGLIEQFESVIAPLPADDPEAMAVRVMSLLDRHQAEQAERLLQSTPSDSAALIRLKGRIALAHRDASAAARYFRRAEAKEPGNRETVFGLLNALSLLGDEQAAAPLREKAKRIDELNSLMERVSAPGGRTDSNLLRSLGAACAALGRVPEARAWYRLALALEPLDAESQQALFRLQAKSAAASRHPVAHETLAGDRPECHYQATSSMDHSPLLPAPTDQEGQ
ncbi:MAG: hypothetical protein U0790_10285 [Isosphaeraceae bacterium]